MDSALQQEHGIDRHSASRSPPLCGLFRCYGIDRSIMSTIEAEAPTTTEETVRPDESPAVAEQSRERLFRWATWVHVGDGADACPLAQAVASPDYTLGAPIPPCEDHSHFHAWLRLPNPLQRRDIVDKATAARARKSRELRDPNSDAAVIIEDELDIIRGDGDIDGLVAEVTERHYQEDLSEAINEVMDIEDPEAPEDDSGETPMKYHLIDQDLEELRRQDTLPEDKRDEGFDRLKAHVESYNAAVEERLKGLQERRAELLRERGLDALVDMVRNDRRELVATEHYIHTYSMWQWYTCTYKPRKEGTPNERVWGDINHMRFNAPPEVIAAVKAAFDVLDRELIHTRRAGNS